MTYIYIAVFSWLLLGIVALIEKNLVDGRIKNPHVLALYTGLFAGFAALIFLPFARFGAGAVPAAHFWFDILCGALFFFGIWSYFTALKHGEVSEILTLSGALTPIFSLAITHYVLHIGFTGTEATAFCLLLLGTVLICYRPVRSAKVIFFATLASIFLSGYYSLVKDAYTPFISNFAFVRLGTFLAALLLLASAQVRANAMSFFRRRGASGEQAKLVSGGLFLSKEIIGGVSFIILNYAISIGNPALVNALQGAEYAFVFVIAALFTVFWPRVLREDISRPALIRKSLAVAIIFFGILILNLK